VRVRDSECDKSGRRRVGVKKMVLVVVGVLKGTTCACSTLISTGDPLP
jgi:hypothetical protein